MRKSKSKNSFFTYLIKNFFLFTVMTIISLIGIVLLGYISISVVFQHYLETGIKLEIAETIIRKEQIIVTPTWVKIISALMIVGFLIIYIGILIRFSRILTLKVKEPLNRLNEGLQSIATKTHIEHIKFEGADEFVQICNSFNGMIDRLNKYEAENKKLQEEKQKIIADISHDLKTPITSIQGYCKAVYDNVVPEEKQKEYLKLIYSKSEELGELITLFHEYSVIERVDYKIKPKEVDVNEFLRKFFADKYEQIQNEQFILEVEIPEKRLFLPIDVLQFRRALNNLISNSLKYNPQNTIIAVFVSEDEENCIIEIRDNGIGIPENLKECIFEPLVTGDNSRSRKHGSGLGLAITKCIIEKHNGSISLVSDKNKIWNTVFKITIPKTDYEEKL